MEKIYRFFNWINKSILRKIVALIVGCLAVMNIFNIVITYKITQIVLRDYFYDKVDESVAVVEQVETKDLQQLASIIDKLCQNKRSRLARGVNNGDMADVKNNMDYYKQMNNCHGYVLTSGDGDILLTSYEGYGDKEKQQLRDFCKFVTEHDSLYNGHVELLGQGACVVTAHSVGESSLVIMCQQSFSDSSYLKTCAAYSTLDFNVFDTNGRCVASSASLGEAMCMTGDVLDNKEVLDSVLVNGSVAHNTEFVSHVPMMSAYKPVFDYKNEVIAFYRASEDAPVMTSIITMLILSLFLVSSIGAFAVAAFCFYYLKRSVVKRLVSIKEATESIARGDLTYELAHIKSGGDEAEKLTEATISMNQSLRDMIGSIRETVQLINVSSRDLSRSSIDMSEGANKQASALQEISTSLDDMASNIHSNSNNTTKTNSITEETNVAIRSIAATASESMKDTRKIAGSMQAIEKLVRQTNILSLNATVEAARAGDAGRGFAVVAKEVGRLADQTKATADAVNVISEKSIAGAENINKLLEGAQPQIDKISELVKEIAASSAEQSTSVDQISAAVSGLDDLTKEHAGIAKEVATNAEELSRTASKMNELVAKFKTQKN